MKQVRQRSGVFIGLILFSIGLRWRSLWQHTTDMFDDMHAMHGAVKAPIVFHNSDKYKFIDCSQINSRCSEKCSGVHHTLGYGTGANSPRPIITKVYGGLNTYWGSGNNRDGVERFLRNIWQGFAAVRFHRPPYGNGLNERAQNVIKTVGEDMDARAFFRDGQVMQDKLNQREHEIYLRGIRVGYQLLYTFGGVARVDLSEEVGSFQITWWEAEKFEILDSSSVVNGGTVVELQCPTESVYTTLIQKIHV